MIVVIAILASIAIPSYQGLTNRARAARALGDINAIKVAAFTYLAESGHWPADVDRGVMPPELEPYLGSGFSFEREHYLLDWDNWLAPGGGSTEEGTGVLVGISIVTDEEHLGQALVDLVGEGAAAVTIDDHYTFILESTADSGG